MQKNRNLSRKYKGTKINKGRLIVAALVTISSIVAMIAIVNIFFIQIDTVGATREYETLRQFAPAIEGIVQEMAASGSVSIPTDVTADNNSFNNELSNEALETALVDLKPVCTLSEINPDYVGWITIDNTSIDYPVVQGIDNHKYLNTTFTGERYRAGTIFMDYRIKNGFDSTLVLLHGHNMRDGTMFAGLNHGLVNEYITIVTQGRELLTYRIISVKVTDDNDPAYELIGRDKQAILDYMARINAPSGVDRFLVLSTCTGRTDEIGRLLVFATLVENALG